MRLRVIDFGHVSALRSQAIYHGIAAQMQAGDYPVLTLANPLEPYVCVGVHQEVALEVDEEYCQQQSLNVVRRHVGGGTVYLDANQLFFHFIYPRALAPVRADALYPLFIRPVVETHQELGINAVFRPVNDIQVNGRKIGGTGAATIGNATVVVGSFMFDFDVEKMSQAIRVPSEKFRDKLHKTLSEYITTIKKELAVVPSREDVKTLFLKQVSHCLNVQINEDSPTANEWRAIEAQELELADPEWTYQVGKKFVPLGVKIADGTHLTEFAHKAAGGMIRVHLLETDGRIVQLLISGDFTCLPATGVQDLAQALVGVALEVAALTEAVAYKLNELNLDIPGVTVSDIVTTVLGAVHR